MKKYILLLTVIYLLINCAKSDKTKIDMTGNWSSAYIKDNNYKYQELYFYEDTLIIFDKYQGLHLPYKYNLTDNRIIITPTARDTTYKGKIIKNNKNNIIIDFGNWKSNMTKISGDCFTLDSLINLGIYDRNISDSLKISINNEFIEYHFNIREIKYYIFHGIENKNTLIKNWQLMIKDTINDYDNEYLVYLINYFNNYKVKQTN